MMQVLGCIYVVQRAQQRDTTVLEVGQCISERMPGIPTRLGK